MVSHVADQTVLTLAHGAPHGGDGWVPRQGTTAGELGAIWADVGVTSEVGRLRAVLVHRPGREIELVEDPASALWFEKLDPERARAQHDALTDLYRSYDVAVHYVEDVALDKPNAYFCRDQFAMTAYGAILARPASASRAGEERAVAVALAKAGVSSTLKFFSSVAKPRKSCDRITPELPLAPISRPVAIASTTSPTSSFLSLCSSWTAENIVRDMFVPVSPSGTGKTFRESIISLLLSSVFAALMNILFKVVPSIPMVLFKSVPPLRA